MVGKLLLSFLRKARRMLLCGCQLRANSHHKIRQNPFDEPNSPSSTTAVKGSAVSFSSRRGFYLHRNGPINSPEPTSPTSDRRPYDCYPEHKIEERMDDARSASYSSELNKIWSHEILGRLSDKFEDVKGELAIRTQELEAQTLLKHRCMKKLHAMRQKMASLQAKNKSFRRTIRKLTRELRELSEPKAITIYHECHPPQPIHELEHDNRTCREDLSTHFTSAKEQQYVGFPTHQFEVQSPSQETKHAGHSTQWSIWQNMQNINNTVQAEWTRSVSLDTVRQLTVQCLQWVLEVLCFENLTSKLRACAFRS